MRPPRLVLPCTVADAGNVASVSLAWRASAYRRLRLSPEGEDAGGAEKKSDSDNKPVRCGTMHVEIVHMNTLRFGGIATYCPSISSRVKNQNRLLTRNQEIFAF